MGENLSSERFPPLITISFYISVAVKLPDLFSLMYFFVELILIACA